MSNGFVWLLLAAVFAHSCPSQDTRPSSLPDDPAIVALAQLDARIYSAEREGLKAVEFSYRPPSSGPRDTTPFRVHVRWEKGKKETVDFQQTDGSPLAVLPEILRAPSAVAGAPSAREQFEQGAKGLVAVFRGVPYSDQFAKWRKRIESQTVNGREEKKIVCEPVGDARFRRVEISLAPKALPWRIEHLLSRPEDGLDRLIDEGLVWTEFDGKLVMTSFKKTRGAATEQIVINYQRKDGFIVPSSYERIMADKPPIRFVFEDVKVER